MVSTIISVEVSLVTPARRCLRRPAAGATGRNGAQKPTDMSMHIFAHPDLSDHGRSRPCDRTYLGHAERLAPPAPGDYDPPHAGGDRVLPPLGRRYRSAGRPAD